MLFFFIMLFSGASFAAGISAPDYSKTEILVKFRENTAKDVQAASIRAAGDKMITSVGRSGYKLVRLGSSKSVMAAVDEYAKNPDVEAVQPDYIYRISAREPNDASYSSLWGLHGAYGMDMESAWDYSTDCSSVIVAVLDTGVNYNQEDLSANMWTGAANHGEDFVDGEDGDPMDLHGHGTHVAGIIGAKGNNNTGVTGVCWKASIMAVRVLDATGAGNTSGIILGIDYAVSHGAKVINMSLGGTSANPAYREAISDAAADGVLFVVAAGNEGENVEVTPTYPCAFDLDNILCVAAIEQDGDLASFSNYGTTSVDVAAPGVDIYSTYYAEETDIYTFEGSGHNWSPTGNWSDSNTVLGYDAMTNPDNYDGSSINYDNSKDGTISRNIGSAASYESVVLSYYLGYDIPDDDDLLGVYHDNSGDPFSEDAIAEYYGGSTGSYYYLFEDRLPDCANQAACYVGFRFTSDISTNGKGVAILDLKVKGHDTDCVDECWNEYETMDGTSMAAPYAAGLAAMIFAKEPLYNYSDVINAIKYGGERLSGLSLATSSGRAVNGWGSYRYIARPSGVSLTALADNVE
ncbi:MAG: S8 family serine peptidase [Oligoflexia bacterium]|nr:S8 family serine peptidase [Oligoflexia bacterium]